MSNTLSDLLKRVEAASGPDEELGLAILNATIWSRQACMWHKGDPTASMDSALSLVERMLPEWHWRAGRGSERPGWAHLNRLHPDHCDRKDEATGYAATPTLALLSALLRALISQESSHG